MGAGIALVVSGCGSNEKTPDAAEGTSPATEITTRESNGSGLYQAGAPLTEVKSARLATVLEHPENYSDQMVRLEGTIDQVCAKKGCWMLLRDGEAITRVTFKDYGFFVPMDAAPGSTVRIDAMVVRETLDEDTAKHYESETEGGDPAAIRGPQEVVSIVASGVEIDLPAPAAGEPAGR